MRTIQRTAVAERIGLLWNAGHLPRRETTNINSFGKDSVALTGLEGFLPFTQGVARGLALPWAIICRAFSPLTQHQPAVQNFASWRRCVAFDTSPEALTPIRLAAQALA